MTTPPEVAPQLEVTPRNFLLDVAELYWHRARDTEANMAPGELRDVLVNADRRRGNQARDWALTFPAIIAAPHQEGT